MRDMASPRALDECGAGATLHLSSLLQSRALQHTPWGVSRRTPKPVRATAAEATLRRIVNNAGSLVRWTEPRGTAGVTVSPPYEPHGIDTGNRSAVQPTSRPRIAACVSSADTPSRSRARSASDHERSMWIPTRRGTFQGCRSQSVRGVIHGSLVEYAEPASKTSSGLEVRDNSVSDERFHNATTAHHGGSARLGRRLRLLGGDECDVLDNGIKRVSDLGPQ